MKRKMQQGQGFLDFTGGKMIKSSHTKEPQKPGGLKITNYGNMLCASIPYEGKLTNPFSSGSKIAGFDMDWTLIKTKSGATWPKSKDDFQFLYKDIVVKKL